MSTKQQLKIVFVEKKKGFDVEAQNIFSDLKNNLKIVNLTNVRFINKYIIVNVDDETYTKSLSTIFSEPPVDNLYEGKFPQQKNEVAFCVQSVPGQFEQRAESAQECLELIKTSKTKKPIRVHYSKIIILQGGVSAKELSDIKAYYINPIDSMEVDLHSTKFEIDLPKPEPVKTIKGFLEFDTGKLKTFHTSFGLAMTIEDLIFVHEYFIKQKREPSETELRVIDTYWSDHCRHTTFETAIKSVEIVEGEFSRPIKKACDAYMKVREEYHAKKEKQHITLMDLATICAKEMRKNGLLDDLDVSEENNACTINVDVEVDGKIEKYLLMFKNETHNHPTEIEPFGGASTCLGGAIRDPLSGRAYVYQAMRVTGGADPTEDVADTLPNKLPQNKIATGAANGYASYGNQIGIATGQVDEVYHPYYVAKRMEVGAVIAAAPKNNVVRMTPSPKDVVILLGGRTGKDGIGGAVGSSKTQNKDTIEKAGAEVQRGNAVCERKIQRLFKRSEATTLIKKCNDFGAGGVSVAVGELAPGVSIDLNKVKTKYAGLDGTQLAISESQERMAVVVAKSNANKFIKLAAEENLEATVIGKITAEKRLVMVWNKQVIVDIDREFLDTNGVQQFASAKITSPEQIFPKQNEIEIHEQWREMLLDLNVCSKIGLVQKFDSTIGGNTVLMPLGGIHQLTPTEGMVAKIPTGGVDCKTVSLMSYGFNPYIGIESPFHMAYYSIIESVAKIVAMGGDWTNIRLSFQEYFEKLNKDAERWGKPFAALLGAFAVQQGLKLPAIGGKDSMSGSYEKIDVPPTLISFAVATGDAENIISPEFKKVNSTIVLFKPEYTQDGVIKDLESFGKSLTEIHRLIVDKKIISAFSLKTKGVAEAVTKMALGNKIGIQLKNMTQKELFEPCYGAMVLEIPEKEYTPELLVKIKNKQIGVTTEEQTISSETNFFRMSLSEALCLYVNKLEKVYKFTSGEPEKAVELKPTTTSSSAKSKSQVKHVRVVIPVFPGTNCEFDSQTAFEKAGAVVRQVLIKNTQKHDLKKSIKELVKAIDKSQIIMLPGGFSGGDEPDGSAKYIVNVFQNEEVKSAVHDFLKNRDGMIIGICNGFQALIKLGLLPYGKIMKCKENMPTLTYNTISHHMSQLIRTKVLSNKSPWLRGVKVGDIHTLPVSHGEGKFVASQELIKQLEENGQIITQYVDLNGKPTMDMPYNPNGSYYAVECITNSNGRIIGKMAHSERIGKNLYKNVPGDFDQKLFENGVKYFKKEKKQWK